MSASAPVAQTTAAPAAPSSSYTAPSSSKMNIDSIIEEENAEKEKLERAREEALEKVTIQGRHPFFKACLQHSQTVKS